MSRTHKDRPYWVIMNDRTLGTVEHHYHIASNYFRSYNIIERGERLLVPYGDHKWILRRPDGHPGMTVEEDLKERFGRFGPWTYDLGPSKPVRWYFEQPQRFEWVGRVTKPREASTEACTVDQPYTRERLYNDCTTEPYTENGPWFKYYNRPPTKERLADNRQKRRYASTGLHNLINEYNTFGEVNDDDWPDKERPHVRFNGGYWD